MSVESVSPSAPSLSVPIVVKLSRQEDMFAVQAGVLRQTMNTHNALKDAYKLDKDSDGWALHAEGAVGEFVLSIALDRCWRGPGTMRGGDVGSEGADQPRIQARSTPRPNGSLIVHRPPPVGRDREDDLFVLVTGSYPKYSVRGWLRGQEAQDARWWRTDTDRPAFFVPQAALRSLETLPRVGFVLGRR